MPRFPYINFPFPYYNRPLAKPKASSSHAPFPADLKETPNYYNSSTSAIYPPAIDSCSFDFENKKNKSSNNNDYLFDLFGLKIYTDDVLLVSLIYFLYSEGVKDEGLFIVLILLLLS